MPKRRLPKTLKPTPAQIADQHLWCRMEVRPQGPHVGLYCAEHGTWIKWIGRKDAAKIQDIL